MTPGSSPAIKRRSIKQVKRKLLVTGASGFLGWNICRIAADEWDVCGTHFSHQIRIANTGILKFDLTDFNSLKCLFQNVRPDACIHTAAAADPNYCQANPSESHKINVDAAIRIARICKEYSIPFIFTSTDLVFDGQNAPYSEFNPVSPVNTYGEQKVLAEKGIHHVYPDAVICRMPLMFGLCKPPAQSFIQPMIAAMMEGRILNLFVDEFRTPISGETAASGILKAMENRHEIIHFGGATRVSRYGFGELVADIFKFNSSCLKACSQKEIKMAAPRPADVSLTNNKAVALGFKPLPLKEELIKIRKHMNDE